MSQFSVSFRIPFNMLGTRMYVNGSTFSSRPYKQGDVVSVARRGVSNSFEILPAEVILSANTSRCVDDFKWVLR